MAFSKPLAQPRLWALPRGRTVDCFVISLIGLFCLVVVESGRFHTKNAMDYYHFWVVGQAVQTMEVSDVYAPAERFRIGHHFLKEAAGGSREQKAAARRRIIIEPTATPFQYALFDLVSTGLYDTDYERFFAFSLLAYMIGLFTLARNAGFNPWTGAAFTAFGTLFFWPVRLDIGFGNVTQIELALVSLYLAALRIRTPDVRHAVAGGVLAFSFFFKPNVVLSIGLLMGSWLLLSETKPVAWYAGAFAVVGLAAIFLPWLRFGRACNWISWFHYVPRMAYTRHFVKDSLPSLVFHTLNGRVHRTLTILSMGALLWIIAQGRDNPAFAGDLANRLNTAWRRDAHLVSLGLCLYLLTDPFVHGQYLVFVLPMAALILGDAHADLGLPRSRSQIIGVLTGLLMISCHPLFEWHVRRAIMTHYWNYAGAALITGFGIENLYRMSTNVRDNTEAVS